MSGHSKWKNIKIRKEKQDAKRGNIFTKMAREIILAVREGGSPDPEVNYSLKMAVQKAKDNNMPGDNIRRAIEKAGGGADGVALEQIMYEGYGPHGVALLVEVTTDNRNRAVADVRSLFTKYGGNLGEVGCVAWMFDKVGLITLDAAGVNEDTLLEAALAAGAQDLRTEEGQFEITTAPVDLHAVRTSLEKAGFRPAASEVTRVPKTTVTLGSDQARTLLRLVESLEDLDDVQQVHANFDIPLEVLEKLAVG